MLGPALEAWLAGREPYRLYPGGGVFADAVRSCDAVHHLGEETSHRLALRSLSVAAAMLGELIQDPPAAAGGLSSSIIIDPESIPDDLPHSWAVTSDSLALRAAIHLRASELVLLKSIDVPAGIDWPTAAERGWVDPYFPTLVAEAGVPVRIVNLRSLSPE